ncbi:unnamed protein product [Amoebophrya sp. A120]|nr:unnamed protein product [Amoebophrya sp. A120]|eukprot:GSA120T00007538001.1
MHRRGLGEQPLGGRGENHTAVRDGDQQQYQLTRHRPAVRAHLAAAPDRHAGREKGPEQAEDLLALRASGLLDQNRLLAGDDHGRKSVRVELRPHPDADRRDRAGDLSAVHRPVGVVSAIAIEV